MKTILRLFVALALGLTLTVAHATNKNVTTVSGTVSSVLIPSNSVRTISIQNTGSGNVRLGLDGGTTNRQLSTPDPTATTGYELVAGKQIILTYPGTYAPPQIRAILESGTTTTLVIATDDPFST